MLPPHLTQDKNPNSQEVQDLLKITNLRFKFTKMHTFGDTLLDGRDELKEKYYYSLYELVVRGSCLCNGHAGKCIRSPGIEYDDDVNAKGMIHGFCQCTHNTVGNNCEKCLPLYNDRPWAEARVDAKNECQKCECNGHAQSCTFNQDIFAASGGVSGGVCDFCQDNTEGRNCEMCKSNHYRDPTRSMDDAFTCRRKLIF
jgi:laminin beta 1